jgi:hypothetical protein
MSLVYTVNAATPGARRHSVYIGGKDHAKNLAKLEQWGISHILNVTPTKDSGIQVCRLRKGKKTGAGVFVCAKSKDQDSLHHLFPSCTYVSVKMFYVVSRSLSIHYDRV